MSLRRVQHCGRDDAHDPHVGRWTHHLAVPGTGPYCPGDPATLERQREAERNPPPGPPNPPQRVEWPVDQKGQQQ